MGEARGDGAIWALEERFWTGGAEHYEQALDPACVMAFPLPAGILSGPAITAGLACAPRWASVAMSARTLGRPAPNLLVLGYRAVGVRDGVPAYEAYCTSTYRQGPGGWMLVQHQQTPVA